MNEYQLNEIKNLKVGDFVTLKDYGDSLLGVLEIEECTLFPVRFYTCCLNCPGRIRTEVTQHVCCYGRTVGEEFLITSVVKVNIKINKIFDDILKDI